MTKIAQEYVSTNEITKIVKNALANRFGRKNVSVRHGTGTAYGWIDAKVSILKPSDCFCVKGSSYCSRCSEALRDAAQSGRKLVYADMALANAEFGTYYSDDGYNTRHDQFILQVGFVQENNV